MIVVDADRVMTRLVASLSLDEISDVVFFWFLVCSKGPKYGLKNNLIKNKEFKLKV